MTSKHTQRYVPHGVYVLAERLKREGVALAGVRGPWRPMRQSLSRLGRNAEKAISLVTNGVAAIVVDTAERAADLSGLLNWCGIDHLEPAANLRPPSGLVAGH